MSYIPKPAALSPSQNTKIGANLFQSFICSLCGIIEHLVTRLIKLPIMDKQYYYRWLIAITALLLTVLAYYPGLHGPFVFDDYPNIIDNKVIWNLQELQDFASLKSAALSSGSGILKRPISVISFAFNILFFGQDPYSFKVVNLIIHLINGGLVWAFSLLLLNAYRRLWDTTLSPSNLSWIALSITTTWLLLPINLTAVLYIVQRMTSLSALFLLLGLIFYIRCRIRLIDGQPTYLMMVFSVAFFGTLSIFSKESGGLLPVYMLIIEAVLFRFKNSQGGYDRFLIFCYLFFVIIPGIIGFYWAITNESLKAAYEGRLFNLPERLLTEARITLLYIKWILLPTPQELTLYHDNILISQGLFKPISTFISLLTIIGLLIIAFIQRNKRPLVTIGIFWFFCGHLMESTVIPLELIFEHRNYLPSIGLLLTISSLLILSKNIPNLSKAIRIFILGMVFAYGAVTWLRANDWEDLVTLTALEAYRNPNSPRVAYDLGKLYGNLVAGPDSEYVPLAYAALEKAAAIKDSEILPDVALIVISNKIKRPVESRWYNDIEGKLRTKPLTFGDVSALEGLVKCASLEGGCVLDNEKVMHIFAAALDSPGLSNRPRMHALLLSKYVNYLINVIGYLDLAKEITKQIIVLSPEDLPYRINLIRLLIALRDKPTAVHELDELRKLDQQNLFFNDINRLEDRIKALK